MGMDSCYMDEEIKEDVIEEEVKTEPVEETSEIKYSDEEASL